MANTIPILDQRALKSVKPAAPLAALPNGEAHLITDSRGRPIRDLRISVTDRCNFRCIYCMPKEVFDKDHQYLEHSALLTFEEITRLARIFQSLGIEKNPPHRRRTDDAQKS